MRKFQCIQKSRTHVFLSLSFLILCFMGTGCNQSNSKPSGSFSSSNTQRSEESEKKAELERLQKEREKIRAKLYEAEDWLDEYQFFLKERAEANKASAPFTDPFTPPCLALRVCSIYSPCFHDLSLYRNIIGFYYCKQYTKRSRGMESAFPEFVFFGRSRTHKTHRTYARLCRDVIQFPYCIFCMTVSRL